MNLENNIKLEKENNIFNNIDIEEKQNKFLETTLGKTINSAMDVAIRAIFPDLVENQVIDIKNSLLTSGLKEGINTAISSAINLGKSAIGIITGKFENISQVQTAIEKGGIIDSISSALNSAIKISTQKGLINRTTSNIIKKGKDNIIKNISNNIEKTLTNQIKSAEKLEMYTENWKEHYNNKDFENMEKEYKKIVKEINNLLPIENTIKEARKIENIHKLIKNNGQNFNITKNEKELANILT